ncbi:MAG: hypothetical protein ACK559_02090 [bacterium]
MQCCWRDPGVHGLCEGGKLRARARPGPRAGHRVRAFRREAGQRSRGPTLLLQHLLTAQTP